MDDLKKAVEDVSKALEKRPKDKFYLVNNKFNNQQMQ